MVGNIYNAISVVAFFAVGFGLLRIINRLETQWVSSDGLRFTAKICLDSDNSDKWLDVRILVDGDALLITGRGRKSTRLRGKWAMSYPIDKPEDRRRHYVIVQHGETRINALLRVPATSRCVAVLDALSKK